MTEPKPKTNKKKSCDDNRKKSHEGSYCNALMCNRSGRVAVMQLQEEFRSCNNWNLPHRRHSHSLCIQKYLKYTQRSDLFLYLFLGYKFVSVAGQVRFREENNPQRLTDWKF